MFRAIRIAITRYHFDRANEEYMAYQRTPDGWRFAVADALHRRLITTERHLSRAING